MTGPRDKLRLLIVEDDRLFAETLALEFSDRGYDVVRAPSIAELPAGAAPFRFAIVDLRLGTEQGLEALEWIKAHSPEARAVMLTGYGSIATAVRAVKLGAANYLTKPIKMEALERALWVDREEDEALGNVPERGPSLARHEREYIEFVLSQCDGNITRAAEWLGLHRQSLQRKLRKFAPNEASGAAREN